MRILFLSRWYPYPPDNGSKLRVFGLLRGLCERHDVTLISFHRPAETADEPAEGIPAPSERRVCPYREFEPGSIRALAGFLSSTPRFLVDTHDARMERLIRDAVARTRYDLVVASQLSMAAYYPAFRGIPAIFEEVELGIYQPEETDSGWEWARARRRVTWAKHRRFMAKLLRHYSCCTVASEAERQLLMRAAPSYQSVYVVPNSVDAEPVMPLRSDREPGSLIFTGSLSYRPNRDAVAWFVKEILPLVSARVRGLRLIVTGEPGSELPPAAPNVVLTGRVPDLRALLKRAAVSIAPIRSGGGTRLKVVEAMAAGVPIVATTKAVEGLDLRHGEHLLVADTPKAFAEAVEALLRNPDEAHRMADRAWQLFRARYDTSVVLPTFLRLVDQAAGAA